MTTALIPKVFDFQTSAETLRAHHWRVFADAYRGCDINCTYCLYKGPGDYGAHVGIAPGSAEADASLGILDLGTTTDPYQPIEATERVTRRTLEAALAQQIPVFILTRATLVTRDIDVLTDLAAQGLVEVCFSVITLDATLSRRLEVRAPSPSDRLAAAATLDSAGIPVTFHTAPVIPGLNSPVQMQKLGYELGSLSGRHVFSAVLGAQKAWWSGFYDVMEAAAQNGEIHSLEDFRAAYARELPFVRDAAINCGLDAVLDILLAFRQGVIGTGAIFVAENYPHLTTGPLEGGIYRWKLPTVYDMAAWVATQGRPVDWARFEAWYSGYQPSIQLNELVRGLWDSGELFLGTTIAAATEPGCYIIGDNVTDTARTTLVARRKDRSVR